VRLVILDEVPRHIPRDALHVTDFISELDPVELVGVFQQLRPESRRDELRLPRQLVYHIRNRFPVLRVQRLVDLVKQIKRRWVALLYSEDQSQRHQRLLSSRQLVHLLHFRVGIRERHLDSYAAEVVRIGVFGADVAPLLVVHRLHDQLGLARRHQLLEHLREVLRDLLERELDRLELPLLQHRDQLLDLLASATPTSNLSFRLVVTYPRSSSSLRFCNFSFWSEKLMNWSRAFLFT
jgi:hypothetical protein